jgi:hypothetical protein
MTPTETVKLVEFVHALCPHQAIDRKTPIAWHAVLRELEFSAAQAAVIALKHSQKFIDVADIVAQARRSAASHPSSRTLTEALEFANRRELDPAGGTPATEEFLKAKTVMLERMQARDEAAYVADHVAERKAAAWLNGAIRGRQPAEEPLGLADGARALPRWQQLPGDPPELRAWLARQPAEAPG